MQDKHREVMRSIQGVVNPNWRERPKGSGIAKAKVNEWQEANQQVVNKPTI